MSHDIGTSMSQSATQKSHRQQSCDSRSSGYNVEKKVTSLFHKNDI